MVKQSILNISVLRVRATNIDTHIAKSSNFRVVLECVNTSNIWRGFCIYSFSKSSIEVNYKIKTVKCSVLCELLYIEKPDTHFIL